MDTSPHPGMPASRCSSDSGCFATSLCPDPAGVGRNQNWAALRGPHGATCWDSTSLVH